MPAGTGEREKAGLMENGDLLKVKAEGWTVMEDEVQSRTLMKGKTERSRCLDDGVL